MLPNLLSVGWIFSVSQAVLEEHLQHFSLTEMSLTVGLHSIWALFVYTQSLWIETPDSNRVPLGVLSGLDSLASPLWLSGRQHRPTCEADALGAVTQVYHHPNL